MERYGSAILGKKQNNMIRYFITSEPKPVYDHKGISLGLTEKRIVCKGNGYKFYRQDEATIQKGLKPVSYKLKKNAQVIADLTNDNFNDNFKVEAREV